MSAIEVLNKIRPLPVPLFGKLDRGIKVIIPVTLALLPFAHIDLSYQIYVGHRLLMFLTAVVCLYMFVSGERSVREKLYLLGTLSYLLMTSTIAAFYFNDTSPIKEFLSIFTVITFSFYLISSPSKKTMLWCLFVIAFFCLDAVFQSVVGHDFFFFPKHHGMRSWGAFIMGSPSFGVFLMSFFFLPFFAIKNRTLKGLMILLMCVGILVTNDRAPFLQISLATYLFVNASMSFKLFFLFFSGLVLSVVTFNFAEYVPFRLYILVESFYTIFRDPSVLLQNTTMSLDQYMDIWTSNISTWVHQAPLFNKIFGFGWGGGALFLQEMKQNPRNHQIYLDILFNIGALGLGTFFYLIFRLFKKLGPHAVIFSTTVLPFSFYSLHTFTWLYVTALSFILACWSYRLKVEGSELRC